MINGIGQKGGLKFGVPDLSNLTMAFDFGAMLAEADQRRDMPQLEQRDLDGRDDGLAYGEHAERSELRADSSGRSGDQRVERDDDHQRRNIERKDRHDSTQRRDDSASGERNVRTASTDTNKRQASVSDLSDAGRGQNKPEQLTGRMSDSLVHLKGTKNSLNQGPRADRQGVESMFDAEEALKSQDGRSKGLTAPRGKGRTVGIEGANTRVGGEKQDLRQALRAMNPESAEATLNRAKGDGEKTRHVDVSEDMAFRAALEASAAQASQASVQQGASEGAQTVVEAAKHAVKTVQAKSNASLTNGSSAGGLADLKAEAEAGEARTAASKAKEQASEARTRFENAMRAMETGDTTVKFADAKLGNVEARISLNGQDLSVRLSVDDAASRQGIMDILAEIRQELKEARLVRGKIDVSRERERGFQDGTSPEGQQGQPERENPANEHGQSGFSLMV